MERGPDARRDLLLACAPLAAGPSTAARHTCSPTRGHISRLGLGPVCTRTPRHAAALLGCGDAAAVSVVIAAQTLKAATGGS